jgi:hypothetical protein
MFTLPYKLGIIASIIIAVFMLGYFKGKTSCEVANTKEVVKIVQNVKYVRQKSDALPSGAVYDGLREWQRD